VQGFQQFLLKHTNVKSIVDSDLKHFDGPNINTVITIFSGKTPRGDNEVVFSRFGTTHTELHRLSYSNPLLQEIKWGVMLVASEEVLGLFDLIRKRGKLIESIGLSVGQGLNLSKSAMVDASITTQFPFLNGKLLPFMNTADGAPFELTETRNFLVNGTNLSPDELSQLEAAEIEPFEEIAAFELTDILELGVDSDDDIDLPLPADEGSVALIVQVLWEEVAEIRSVYAQERVWERPRVEVTVALTPVCPTGTGQ